MPTHLLNRDGRYGWIMMAPLLLVGMYIGMYALVHTGSLAVTVDHGGDIYVVHERFAWPSKPSVIGDAR